jgi:hypothetical protein
MPKQVAVILLAVGMLLVAASLFWPSVAPTAIYWSAADTAARDEAVDAYHELAYKSPDSPETQLAKEKFEHYQQKFESALEKRDTSGRVSWWLGTGLIALGTILFLVQRNR